MRALRFRREKDKFEKSYRLREKLGKGQVSIVYSCQSRTNTKNEFAVKVIDKNKEPKTIDKLKWLSKEIEILREMDFEGIIKLHQVFESKSKVYILTELAKGGELFDRIIAKTESGSYSEQEASNIVLQVAQSLKYLHDKNIVHRDLKPEVLLLEDERENARIKLAGFHFAAKCTKPLSEGVGTLVYIAPEVLRGDPYLTSPDMWSLGVITYILLCGYPPFFHTSQEELKKKIVKGRYRFREEDFSHVSYHGKEFIRSLLRRKVAKRMSAIEVLNHPWIVNSASLPVRKLDINSNFKKFQEEMKEVAFSIQQAIESKETTSFSRTKLMFVGRGQSGKTSTIRSVLGKKFIETKSTEVCDAEHDIELRKEDVADFKEVDRNVLHNRDFTQVVGEVVKRNRRRDFGRLNKTDGKEMDREQVMTKEGNNKVHLDVKKLQESCVKVAEKSMLKGEVQFASKRVGKPEVNKVFSVWDFGGQEVFYTLHHLFLNENGIYILCFNAEKLCSEKERENELKELTFWLDSISLHSPKSPFLLVGTHSRNLTKESFQEIETIFFELLRKYDSLESLEENVKMKLSFYPVENCESPSENEVEWMNALKNGIESASDNESAFSDTHSKKIPVSWVYFIDTFLGKYKDLNKVEVDFLKKEFILSGFPEEDFLPMLNCYNQNGTFVTFKAKSQSEQAIEKFVVLKPEWLMKGIRCLLYDPILHKKYFSDKGLQKKVRKYEKTSIIEVDVLREVLKLDGFDTDETEFMIAFLLQSLLLSPFDFEAKDKAPKFIIPSMLPKSNARNSFFPVHISAQKDFVAKIQFSSAFPKGIYERIACLLLRKFNDIDAAVPMIRHSEALFIVGEGRAFLKEDQAEKKALLLIKEGHAALASQAVEFIKECIIELSKTFFEGKKAPKMFLLGEEVEGDQKWCEYFACQNALKQGKKTINCENEVDYVESKRMRRFFPIWREIQAAQTHSAKDLEMRWMAFLAHEWGCHGEVKEVAALLAGQKVSYWLDEERLKSLSRDIIEGLRYSRKVVVFLSKRYFERTNDSSTNAHKEFTSAAHVKGLNNMVFVALEEKYCAKVNWPNDTTVHYHAFTENLHVIDMSSAAKRKKNLHVLIEALR